VTALQNDEGIVAVARLADSDQAQVAVGGQGVHEADHDVGVALQRPPHPAQMTVDPRNVARGGVDEPDSGQAVQVIVDDPPHPTARVRV
jgi:hypothetical protein